MKSPKEIDGSSIFDEILNATSESEKLFVTKSLEISAQIITVMESNGLKQKDLAAMLGKSEAEISKWLSGFHNFTLKTLVKIEVALKSIIVTTPEQVEIEINHAVENIFISEKNWHVSNTLKIIDIKNNKKYTPAYKGEVIKMPTNTQFNDLNYQGNLNKLNGTYS